MTKKQKKKNKNPRSSRLINRLKTQKKIRNIDPRKILDIASRNLQAGKIRQAEQLYQQLLTAEPENIIALYSLGLIAYQTGEIRKGTQLLRRAISVKPDFVDGHNLLGILLGAQGDLHGAIKCYERVISLSADYFEAYNNLGSIYYKLGQADSAIANFINAISIKPDFISAQNNLEAVIQESENLEGIIFDYQQTLSISQKDFFRYCNLAKALQNCGHIQLSLKFFSNALLIEPDNTEVHRSISKLKKYTIDDSHIKSMENIFFEETTTDSEKMHLAFALGKAYEDCKQYDRSFQYLSTANKLKRSTFKYSSEETINLNATIKKTFDSLLNVEHLPHGLPDKTPIFILGMPRSGTSLVEQILASHPDVYGAGELTDFKRIFCEIANTNQLESAFQFLAREFNKILPHLGARYIQKIRTISASSQLITDKMPHNFQVIGLIRLALPNAKIIHCYRHPMDNCFSIYKNYFATTHPFSYELQELGHYYLLYQDLMDYWHKVFPGTIYDISYEDLVENQEDETRKLLHECGLKWNDDVLSFYKTSRRVATASAAQVRQPIYKDSIHLWKRHAKHLQPLRKILDTKEGFLNC